MALVHERPFAGRAFEESPWYYPISPFAAHFASHPAFPSADELTALHRARCEAAGLNGAPCAALRFVDVPKKKPRRRGNEPIALSQLYEGRIVELGEVPTRVDDWHDYFNALAFVAFPRAKWALHHRNYRLLRDRLPPGTTRLPGARTREQDALALFDEGGLSVVLPWASWAQARSALDRSYDLSALCRHEGALVLPFGHALYEHLVEGLPCPLATVQLLAMDSPPAAPVDLLDAVDAALATALCDPREFCAPLAARGLSLDQLTPPLPATNANGPAAAAKNFVAGA